MKTQRERALANEIISLTIGNVEKMNFYQEIAIKSIRDRLSTKESIDELISAALFVLRENVRNVIEQGIFHSERYPAHARIQKNFPNWKEWVEDAIKTLNDYRNSENAFRLADENSQLRTEINSLNRRLELLEDRMRAQQPEEHKKASTTMFGFGWASK